MKLNSIFEQPVNLLVKPKKIHWNQHEFKSQIKVENKISIRNMFSFKNNKNFLI